MDNIKTPMKIKILYIIPNMAKNSGVSSVIINYLKNINKEIFQIDFLLMKKYKESYEKELKENGSNIFYLKNKFSIISTKTLKKEVEEFYKNNNYDIVELHAPTFSFIFLKIAKKCKIPIRIMHTHSTIRSTNKIKNIISKILNYNFKTYTNIFFACSEKSGKYWYGKKICKNDNYKVIKNGINIDQYYPNNELRENLRKQYNIADNRVIGFVGRVSKDKNLPFLIQVIREIIKIDKNYKVMIIGDGQELDNIKNMSKDIKENIIFMGNRNDVNKLLNCIDILVLPSKREGLPMVAIEAQLTNIQCYLSDTITREVDLGKAEFLKLSKKVWVEKILHNSTNNINNEIDREKFNIDICVKELEKIYDEII